MLIDQARIIIRSGRGGDGAMHFHREKYVPRGGPDGGDGGHGGDVILEVIPTLNTLSSFRHQSHFYAQAGARGGPNNMSGKSASDLIILIPPGTIVYDDPSGELMGDLVSAGQRLVVAKGGRGGKGNQHFATSRNQAPTMAERGEPEQQRGLRLELKLIADIGIIGVPNAGKSSLLAVVTRATPKIGDYPFTTLEPNLGVAELDEDTSLVLADIPGLIEGSHLGVGLGFDFLRHIQRTRVIIHLINGLSDDPLADYSQINSELALFDPALGKKPQLVAFNKIDDPEAAGRWPEVKLMLEARGIQAVAISAYTGDGVKPLLWQAHQLLESLPEVETPAAAIPVYRFDEDFKSFKIEQVPDGWRVSGPSIERSAAMTYWEHQGSVRRFQHIMETLGVDKALREAGVQNGDTVFIGDSYELEWQD
ncbi:MAG TPA: GTPase ObgE [Anaerolineaceae bacterium]